MRFWLTRDDPGLRRTTVKRFEPSHWMIDFPRGSMAAVVSRPDRCELTVTAIFAGRGDLVGLIYRSDDEDLHVAHARVANRDYRRCRLSFRWQSDGVIPLDEPNGPTLTIEGLGADGAAHTWYVRLWNYASGSPTDARITLDFDQLDAGYTLPADAERVQPVSVDRMFISLVPPGHVPGDDQRFASPLQGEVRISDISVEGSGSVVAVGDAFVPEHDLRICTSYDDCYNMTPERVVDGLERLGYRQLINHYVGMSHYPALDGQGLVDPGGGICLPARRWHESFAAIAATRGYRIIWSLSMELLDQFCPPGWKQRDQGGKPATTGYDPPSTLVSPSSAEGVAYLGSIAEAFVAIGVAAGMETNFQIGEPWWWLNDDAQPCLYDDAAAASWPAHEAIVEIDGPLTVGQVEVLDLAATALVEATASIISTVRHSHPGAIAHLLLYLPTIWDPSKPNRAALNLPVDWVAAGFDVVQVEDYEWVQQGRALTRLSEHNAVLERLKVERSECHYLAGFVVGTRPVVEWDRVVRAADEATSSGFREVFVWALPQVFRDNLTLFEGDTSMESFQDVAFPLDLGLGLEVSPTFSTSVSTSVAGFEHRNVNWTQSRLRFNVGSSIRSLEDLQTLLAFYRQMHGNACAFRLRDPFDHSSAPGNGSPSATDCDLGVGDGDRLTFPLIKSYGSGERRRVTRPVAASLRIAVDGVEAGGWLLGEGGVIEFAVAPTAGAIVSAGFEFDVPVRFEDPALRVSQRNFRAGECIDVGLIEVREG